MMMLFVSLLGPVAYSLSRTRLEIIELLLFDFRRIQTVSSIRISSI